MHHYTSLPNVPRFTRAISIASGLLVICLAIAAFALSFQALQDLAHKHGFDADKAWLWPFVLDGSIVVFSLAALRSQLFGQAARYEMSLVFFATAASIAFNIIHAPSDIVSRLMAVVPPFSLFLSFEVLIRQIRSEARAGFVPGDEEEGEDSGKATNVVSRTKRATTKKAKVGQRQAKVSEFLGQGLDLGEIAKRLRVPTKTVRRDREALGHLEEVRP